MAEGNHTPGPWAPNDNGEIVGPDGRPVAYAAASRMTRDDLMMKGPATANAALIASAPTLLAERDRLKEINADLLAALVMTKSWLESEPLWNAVTTQPGCETFGKRIVTAISRATVAP